MSITKESELPFEERIVNQRWQHRHTPIDVYHKFHRQTVENIEAFWEGWPRSWSGLSHGIKC